MKLSVPNLILLLMVGLLSVECAQNRDKTKRPSPPASDTSLVNTAQVIIDYSSPAVKKRKLLGGLIPIDKIWRTGANEATNFIVDKDILVMGQLLPKGRYSYFTVASESMWVIIFNKNWDQWGSYSYDESEDALRIQVLPYQVEQFQERMKFYFKDEELVFHWGNLQYKLELQVAG